MRWLQLNAPMTRKAGMTLQLYQQVSPHPLMLATQMSHTIDPLLPRPVADAA